MTHPPLRHCENPHCGVDLYTPTHSLTCTLYFFPEGTCCLKMLLYINLHNDCIIASACWVILTVLHQQTSHSASTKHSPAHPTVRSRSAYPQPCSISLFHKHSHALGMLLQTLDFTSVLSENLFAFLPSSVWKMF